MEKGQEWYFFKMLSGGESSRVTKDDLCTFLQAIGVIGEHPFLLQRLVTIFEDCDSSLTGEMNFADFSLFARYFRKSFLALHSLLEELDKVSTVIPQLEQQLQEECAWKQRIAEWDAEIAAIDSQIDRISNEERELINRTQVLRKMKLKNVAFREELCACRSDCERELELCRRLSRIPTEEDFLRLSEEKQNVLRTIEQDITDYRTCRLGS